jgi:type I restriction enzyme, S subunit
LALKSKTKLLDSSKSEKWQTLTLSEAGVTLIDCLHSTPPASDNGYPYIAIPQIKDNHVDISTSRRISNESFVKWTEKALPRENDIILSRRCNPGETAPVPLGIECAIGQNLVLLRSDGKKVFPPFLRWLVRGREWWTQIDKFINVGAIFDSLRCGDIPNFRLTIPSLPEQYSITHILDALENKIGVIQNQNKILEQTAQAIFKSWFVDFDGVTEFEDSELGKIPKGWSIDNLENICEITMGQSPPGTSYNKNKDGIIFFQGKTDFGDFFPTPRIYCTSPKRFAEINDILFTVRAPIGSINIAKERCSIGRGLASLRLKNNHGSFLYYLLKESYHEWQKFESDGTVYGAVTKDDVLNFKIVKPKLEKIISFNQIADPLYHNIWKNNEQIQSLTKTRDTLLPKLMSGEIRV